MIPGLLTLLLAPAAEPVGVVCNLKVVSDKVPDVSSMEAWKASFLKDGMTDREKALAAWRTAMFRPLPPASNSI